MRDSTLKLRDQQTLHTLDSVGEVETRPKDRDKEKRREVLFFNWNWKFWNWKTSFLVSQNPQVKEERERERERDFSGSWLSVGQLEFLPFPIQLQPVLITNTLSHISLISLQILSNGDTHKSSESRWVDRIIDRHGDSFFVVFVNVYRLSCCCDGQIFDIRVVGMSRVCHLSKETRVSSPSLTCASHGAHMLAGTAKMTAGSSCRICSNCSNKNWYWWRLNF
jgi:hypothetical protein